MQGGAGVGEEGEGASERVVRWILRGVLRGKGTRLLDWREKFGGAFSGDRCGAAKRSRRRRCIW